MFLLTQLFQVHRMRVNMNLDLKGRGKTIGSLLCPSKYNPTKVPYLSGSLARPLGYSSSSSCHLAICCSLLLQCCLSLFMFIEGAAPGEKEREGEDSFPLQSLASCSVSWEPSRSHSKTPPLLRGEMVLCPQDLSKIISGSEL